MVLSARDLEALGITAGSTKGALDQSIQQIWEDFLSGSGMPLQNMTLREFEGKCNEAEIVVEFDCQSLRVVYQFSPSKFFAMIYHEEAPATVEQVYTKIATSSRSNVEYKMALPDWIKDVNPIVSQDGEQPLGLQTVLIMYLLGYPITPTTTALEHGVTSKVDVEFNYQGIRVSYPFELPNFFSMILRSEAPKTAERLCSVVASSAQSDMELKTMLTGWVGKLRIVVFLANDRFQNPGLMAAMIDYLSDERKPFKDTPLDSFEKRYQTNIMLEYNGEIGGYTGRLFSELTPREFYKMVAESVTPKSLAMFQETIGSVTKSGVRPLIR